MKPATAPDLASRGTDIRLAQYDAQGALSLTADLLHLESAARVPADLDLTWLTRCLQRPGFALVTASIDGRLVGFVAANCLGEAVAIERLVVAASALSAHPELSATLLYAVIDATGLPWADVLVAHSFPGLGVLLEHGWRPLGHDLASDEEPIRLSAAHVDRA